MNPLIQQFPIGCGFKARTLANGLFVSGCGEREVTREDVGFNPLFRLLPAKVDREHRSVTCSLIGLGAFEQKAIWVDGVGAVLLSGTPEEDVRSWRPAFPQSEPGHPAPAPRPAGSSSSRTAVSGFAPGSSAGR